MEYRICHERVKGNEHALWELLVKHREELTTNKTLMVLKPDWARYHAIENAGGLMSLFAYCGEELVGYSVNFIMPNMHYADVVQAHNDVMYTLPEHRGRLGIKLIRETERSAKELGAHILILHAKPDTLLDEILPRMGYRLQDKLHLKEL